MTEKHSPLLPCSFCGDEPKRNVLKSGFRKITCESCDIGGSQDWWDDRCAVNGLPEAIAALEEMLIDPPATLDEPDTDAEVIIKMREIAHAALTKLKG